jgi:ssDNA-binding replication factor A large subunit
MMNKKHQKLNITNKMKLVQIWYPKAPKTGESLDVVTNRGVSMPKLSPKKDQKRLF